MRTYKFGYEPLNGSALESVSKVVTNILSKYHGLDIEAELTVCVKHNGKHTREDYYGSK